MLSVAQAAERLGVTTESIYVLLRRGKIAHYRIGLRGGKIRIKPEDLDLYLESCRVESEVARPSRPLKHVRLRP